MISHAHKAIFIHIPKCGGTSTSQALINRNFTGDFNKASTHWRKYDINLHTNYFKFTSVRNPWDRFVSEYLWRNKRDWNHHTNQDIRWDMSFKECCNALVQEKLKLIYPRMERIHLWSQHKMIEYAVGSCDNINFIGKFENLQEDFDIICDKIGIPQEQLPHKNKSKRKHYTEYYDDETKELVAKKYAKDIEYFDYRFGE